MGIVRCAATMGEIESVGEGRVLVTGASGFLGRHLTRRLLSDGVEVHAVSRRDRQEPGAVWHRCDLERQAEALRLFERLRPRLVFHLAGFVSGARELAAVSPAMRRNLDATLHVLLAAHGAGAERIVLAGSQEEPAGDRWPPVPGSPYALSKFAASTAARTMHALYGVPTVIGRIFMVYGPGRQDEGKLIPYLARTLLAGGTAELTSGRRAVDWVYVEDVVDGLLLLAIRPDLEGETLDLGTGVATTVADVARRVRALAGDGEITFGARPDRPHEVEVTADPESTRRRTGWWPGVALEEGLERTLAWFRSHPT